MMQKKSLYEKYKEELEDIVGELRWMASEVADGIKMLSEKDILGERYAYSPHWKGEFVLDKKRGKTTGIKLELVLQSHYKFGSWSFSFGTLPKKLLAGKKLLKKLSLGSVLEELDKETSRLVAVILLKALAQRILNLLDEYKYLHEETAWVIGETKKELEEALQLAKIDSRRKTKRNKNRKRAIENDKKA